jgi:hypothetical protein
VPGAGTKAFSSEVETGLRKENASNQESTGARRKCPATSLLVEAGLRLDRDGRLCRGQGAVQRRLGLRGPGIGIVGGAAGEARAGFAGDGVLDLRQRGFKARRCRGGGLLDLGGLPRKHVRHVGCDR